MRDPYEVLGVSKSATEAEIKKAFRNLAIKHHPDRGGDAEKFKEVNEAYQILSDPQKRKTYDQFGKSAFEQGGGNSGFSGFSGGQGFGGFSGFNMDFDFGGSGFEDIFSSIFEGFGGGRRSARNGEKLDITVKIEISLSESMTGVSKTFEVNRKVRCEKCGGSGSRDGRTDICGKCGGSGQIAENRRTPFGIFKTVGTCFVCGGSGKIIKEKCLECSGSGTKRKVEKISIEIPAGIGDGEGIRVKGKGDAGKTKTGDLLIFVSVSQTEDFFRDGDDLVIKTEIPYSKFLLGGKIKLETPTETIEIRVPENSSVGDILKIPGKGFAKSFGRHGNLLVQLNLKVPKTLTKDQRKLVEELEKFGM